MTILDLDLETYSPTPITHGTHRYAEDAEILLFAWGIDGGAVSVVDEANGEPRPAELREALADPAVIVRAHNSGFDRTILRHTGTPIAINRWRDTMVQALAHSLPGSLGELCDILRVEQDKAKDKAGKALIQLFCKPRPVSSKIRRATRATHPAEWDRFIEYAALDIHAMRAIAAKLPTWNYQGEELALWHLDQMINDRGMCMDVTLAHAAVGAVARAQKILAARTQDMTDGAVQAATQRDAMLRHMMAAYGVELPDMKGSTLERYLADPAMPAALRELLAIRVQASTTSTSKYATLIKSVSRDGRLRGTKQFCGASRTGRWAGRIFQPDNMPSRGLLPFEEVEVGIEALKADAEDLVFDDVMKLTSSAIRGCIVAPPGKKLVIADLSNIEGRVLAWLAGERWKLQAFRDFDAGTGHDLYKLAYAKSFGIKPEDVTKAQRQVGKVQELALGYEGGVGAFLTFAAAYSLDLEDMGRNAIDAIPADILEEARGMLGWTKAKGNPTFGLSDQAWLVCESFKRSWRQAHPAVASLWKDLGDAVRCAIQQPGVTVQCRAMRVRRDAAWLRIRLPSGRFLCYPSPQVDDGGQISYMGINQYSRKWERLKTYGGKLVENCTQAAARDVLARSMPAIESAGYAIVLSVHDELLTETPDTEEYSSDALSALMATPPEWAPDLPLAAAGFEAYRYRKD